MITLPQPSLALNAVDPWNKHYTVPKPRYQMEFSRNIQADMTPQAAFEYVKHIASLTKEGKLKCLVINCHGATYAGGSLGKGLCLGTGIDYTNKNVFAQLRGVVETIYLVACGIGQNRTLCSVFAQYSHAVVYAATELQIANNRFQALFNVPKNCLDRFEGDLYQFKPDATYQLVTQAGSKRR